MLAHRGRRDSNDRPTLQLLGRRNRHLHHLHHRVADRVRRSLLGCRPGATETHARQSLTAKRWLAVPACCRKVCKWHAYGK